jgi:hypothetical protein
MAQLDVGIGERSENTCECESANHHPFEITACFRINNYMRAANVQISISLVTFAMRNSHFLLLSKQGKFVLNSHLV